MIFMSFPCGGKFMPAKRGLTKMSGSEEGIQQSHKRYVGLDEFSEQKIDASGSGRSQTPGKRLVQIWAVTKFSVVALVRS